MDIYQRTFRVRYSETGTDGQLKPISIFKYFQDAASEHAYLQGISALHLRARDYAWVVQRYHATIRAYPRWNEPIHLETWRCPHKNLYELRIFEIRSGAGELLVTGKSIWVMIHFPTKRPVRLSRLMTPELLAPPRQIDNDLPEIPACGEGNPETVFRIRRSDLDFNGHVNNTAYIEWALETGPETVILNRLPADIDVHYISDAGYGDMIASQAQAQPDCPGPAFLHRIMRRSDNRELSRLRIVWHPGEGEK
ncbi:MAG: acyl-[acyl-carrier-protein] thioesterase [Thermodesulfobacteriota bacterium]